MVLIRKQHGAGDQMRNILLHRKEKKKDESSGWTGMTNDVKHRNTVDNLTSPCNLMSDQRALSKLIRRVSLCIFDGHPYWTQNAGKVNKYIFYCCDGSSSMMVKQLTGNFLQISIWVKPADKTKQKQSHSFNSLCVVPRVSTKQEWSLWRFEYLITGRDWKRAASWENNNPFGLGGQMKEK